jgi:hypothetical protein
MAKDHSRYITSDLRPLVRIGAALDCLHDANPPALSAPLSHRRYDSATLARLWTAMITNGIRVRGEIDHGRPQWIEPAEMMDYELAYTTFPVVGLARVNVVVALSRRAYPADQITDRSAPSQYPDATAPYYRLVAINLMVDTVPLLRIGRWLAYIKELMRPRLPRRKIDRVLAGLVIRDQTVEGSSGNDTICLGPPDQQAPAIVQAHAPEATLAASFVMPESKRRRGRPSSKELFREEARRRLAEGNDIPETLKEFANKLADWLKKNHPDAPTAVAKTIENDIPDLWADFQTRKSNPETQ